MKAVIYARYSSDNQREESIEGQIRDCTAFAEKNGIVTSHSLCRSSFQTRTHFVGLRVCVFYCKVRFAPTLSISRGIESTIRSAPLFLLSKPKPPDRLRFGFGAGTW